MPKNVMGAAVLAGALVFTAAGGAGAATGPAGTPTAADTAAIGQVTGGRATLDRLASTKFPGAYAAVAAAGAKPTRARRSRSTSRRRGPSPGLRTSRPRWPTSLSRRAPATAPRPPFGRAAGPGLDRSQRRFR